MKRNEFLKLSGLGVLALGINSCKTERKSEPLKNWAGNLTFSSIDVQKPSSLEELIMAYKSDNKFKSLGTRHCFNTIADTEYIHISTSNLNKVLEIDEENLLVWVESGIKYGDLGLALEEKGYALHNLASLPHISVMGAVSTATHGSGDRNGNLASEVEAIEWVVPGGMVKLFRKGDPEFEGMVVGLGALGTVYRLALKIQPSYQVAQFLFENLPMDACKEHFDEIYQSGYSVSMFTTWENKMIDQVWVKRRLDEEYTKDLKDFWGAKPATENLHPLKGNSPINCTEQLGVPGPWYERLPHFKMDFTPSNGEELQSEYFVPRENVYEALMAIESLKEIIRPVLFVSEIRSIKADNLWMSMASGRDSIAFHFTWKPMTPEVMEVLPQIEAKLKPFGVRPHWGKLFTMSGQELKENYPKWDDFYSLINKFDSGRMCTNIFLEKLGF
ncbi:MAG: Alditol oxidase [Bacteroidota bacterium]